jgi:L-ribulose-5-phosphate 3-epimerase
MGRFRIGVIADSLRMPIRDALSKSAELGADGVQIYAVSGEVSPEALSPSARRELRKMIDGLGLELSALCGDLGGHGFERRAENVAKVARSKAIADLAVDLGTRVVTTHAGVIRAETRGAMCDAFGELGAYAAARGLSFAIETGPETAGELASFVDQLGSPGVGVNLDPANLVMVTGDDPVAAVHTLAAHIVHTHAKDGVRHAPCDPVAVYAAFAEGGIAALEMGRFFSEVPIGQGAVPWDAYLGALAAIGYDGYLTIEREVGADPVHDVGEAVRFLRERTK